MIKTVKDLYEYTLTSVNKEGIPHIHLTEFNRFANEAVVELERELYMLFETSQNALDHLRPLRTTATYSTLTASLDYQNAVQFDLPADYRRLTGMRVAFKVTGPVYDRCYSVGDIFDYPVKRLDDDTHASIVADPFQRPAYHNPYYKMLGDVVHVLTGAHTNIDVFRIYFDYLKEPAEVNITFQQAFQDTIDNSANMEFNTDMNDKIKDRIVQKILEKNRDQRLQSNVSVEQPRAQQDVAAAAQRGAQMQQ